MKRFRKHISFLVTIVAIFHLAPGGTQMVAASVNGHAITSKGACVIDYDTGVLLFGYEENTRRPPASMIKLVAAYVLYDAIETGEISFDTVTYISPRVSEISYNKGFSNVPLPVGAAVTIRDLLDAVIVASACAATAAIGEALCGTEWAFMMRMNEKVAELGIDAYFYDSYGVSADNRISPLGMANLARHLIQDYPQILQLASQPSITFRNQDYKNTNQLLGEYWGVDGIKTGFTDAAGYCFVGTATRENRRIITVTMGSVETARFADSRILLDYGFAVADSVVSEFNAKPSAANLILDDIELPLYAYLIGGNHYFRLRDMAILLNGTVNQFNINWNHELKIVSLYIGLGYSEEDQNLIKLDSGSRRGIPTPSQIMVGEAEHELDVYMIDSYNYFRLRDLGTLIGFEVDWIEETRTVILNTSKEQIDEVDHVSEEEPNEPIDSDVDGSDDSDAQSNALEETTKFDEYDITETIDEPSPEPDDAIQDDQSIMLPDSIP